MTAVFCSAFEFDAPRLHFPGALLAILVLSVGMIVLASRPWILEKLGWARGRWMRLSVAVLYVAVACGLIVMTAIAWHREYSLLARAKKDGALAVVAGPVAVTPVGPRR